MKKIIKLKFIVPFLILIFISVGFVSFSHTHGEEISTSHPHCETDTGHSQCEADTDNCSFCNFIKTFPYLVDIPVILLLFILLFFVFSHQNFILLKLNFSAFSVRAPPVCFNKLG